MKSMGVIEKRSSRASHVFAFAVRIRAYAQPEEARLAAQPVSGNGFATLGAVTQLTTNIIVNINDDAFPTENTIYNHCLGR